MFELAPAEEPVSTLNTKAVGSPVTGDPARRERESREERRKMSDLDSIDLSQLRVKFFCSSIASKSSPGEVKV